MLSVAQTTVKLINLVISSAHIGLHENKTLVSQNISLLIF
jgi:hypothetical protein